MSYLGSAFDPDQRSSRRRTVEIRPGKYARGALTQVIGLVGGGFWRHATDSHVFSGDRQHLAERWARVGGGGDSPGGVTRPAL